MAFLRTTSRGAGTYPDELYVVSIEGGKPKCLTSDNVRIDGVAWTGDSRNIIFGSERGGIFGLWRISSSGGEPVPVSASGHNSYQPTISYDSKKLVYVVQDAATTERHIFRYEIPALKGSAKSPKKLISTRNGISKNAEYSPDGNKIVFMSNSSGTREIWACNSEGLNAVRLTNFFGPRVTGPRWSPDGVWITFDAAEKEDRDIYKIRAEGGQAIRLTTSKADDTYPNWSSDGKWIYFRSDRTGKRNLWKIPSNGGEPTQVSSEYALAFESKNGNWLFLKKWHFLKELSHNIPYIFKMPVEGGPETLVLCPFNHGLSEWTRLGVYSWEVFDNGIYFMDIDANDKASVKFFDFSEKKVSNVISEIFYPGNIDVSPDQRYILNSPEGEEKLDTFFGESNIHLVENWR
jgi:Tol biopolymer transport system component